MSLSPAVAVRLIMRCRGYCHYDESAHGDGNKNRPEAVSYLIHVESNHRQN